MSDLREQLRLEDDLVNHGVERYRKSVDQAEDQNRVSDTGYGRRLMQRLVQPVSDALKEVVKDTRPGNYGKYKSLIRGLDPDVLAYIGVKTVLDNLHAGCTVTSVVMNIGLRIEDEIRFSSFRDINPEYYDALMRDFNKKNTKAYRHMRNVLTVVSAKKGFKWDSWAKTSRVGVGSIILNAITTSTDLVEITRKRAGSSMRSAYILVPTDEAVEWISSYHAFKSILHPYTKPCVIQPDEWAGLYNGGYWSQPMRMRHPLIKGLNKDQKKFVEDHDLHRVYTAVNKVQNTAWRVNTRVLEVMEDAWNNNWDVGLPKKEPYEIPKFSRDTEVEDMDEETKAEFMKWKAEAAKLYSAEISRKSKSFEISRIISMAKSYTAYGDFWFVYQCDFRGRLYASSSGLNPQGAEYNKALLRFSEGVPLGEHGLKWLSVHGANCYGVDKVSFDDRLRWVSDNERFIIASAHDPHSNKEFWTGAECPFMFLAFCFEYTDAVHSKDPTQYISTLPVGMDGSCNGIQNFSAMLRDAVGGAATNLVDSDKPKDIYQEVADRAAYLINKSDVSAILSDSQADWQRFMGVHSGLPRKLTKRAVMTLPYGCTKYSCFDFVYEALDEIDPDFFKDRQKAVAYFTDFLWQAIEDVVIAARAAMDWLQEVAKITAKRQLPVWWVSPVGFPVYQDNKSTKATRVSTALMGKTTRLTLQEPTRKISSRKQVQGIAPNFVHSLDAAHMMLCVTAAHEAGIKSFAMIHDDFGTHAGNTERFHEIIRESFVDMYKNNEPLEDLYVSCSLTVQEPLPPVPDYGDLDINEVLKSTYFFA